MTELQQLQQHIAQAIEQQQLHRLIFSQCTADYPLAQGLSALQKVSLRLVKMQQQIVINAVFHHQQQDITQNYPLTEALSFIENLLPYFKQINLFTHHQEIQFKQGKKSNRLLIKAVKNTTTQPSITQHNREKQRYIEQNSAFLQHLGISDAQANIIPTMSKKWKQINKFIEVLSTALPQKQDLHIVDFGCGKGYLTFALYDYLTKNDKNPHMVGVELRHHLVEFCQKVAQDVEFKQLSFFEGDVRTYQPKQLDVMIALHACDVATDFAIHTGIRLNAELIVCSPCCHKELRPQLRSPQALQPMLQFGIHAGQQAEMLTDSLRALFLQAYGYETKVFEFISPEHTSKNKMILAIKKPHFKGIDQTILAQIDTLKSMYGIQSQMLEQLLQQN